MRRLTASIVVALMLAASGRLLVCDYSCFDHTRAVQSTQPSCHEPAPDDAPFAFTAGQNDCDTQPGLAESFVAGKVTSLGKPAPAVTHAVDSAPLAYSVNCTAHARAPGTVSRTPHRNTPLRI